ncbi:MAG: hypothetical protein QOF49_251, partial [Chloroflexota bacterium]|nr:hypothetical protein [Chloroflexota bacterium]
CPERRTVGRAQCRAVGRAERRAIAGGDRSAIRAAFVGHPERHPRADHASGADPDATDGQPCADTDRDRNAAHAADAGADAAPDAAAHRRADTASDAASDRPADGPSDASEPGQGKGQEAGSALSRPRQRTAGPSQGDGARREAMWQRRWLGWRQGQGRGCRDCRVPASRARRSRRHGPRAHHQVRASACGAPFGGRCPIVTAGGRGIAARR